MEKEEELVLKRISLADTKYGHRYIGYFSNINIYLSVFRGSHCWIRWNVVEERFKLESFDRIYEYPGEKYECVDSTLRLYEQIFFKRFGRTEETIALWDSFSTAVKDSLDPLPAFFGDTDLEYRYNNPLESTQADVR